MSQLFVYGDSITFGAYDLAGGWVQRLRSLVDQRNIAEDDYHFLIYNLGVSGDTAEDVLVRFEAEFLARRSEDLPAGELFLFAIGINDSQWLVDQNKPRFTVMEYRKNLKALLALARKYSSKIGFVGLTPVDEEIVNPMPWAPERAYRNERVEQFNAQINDLCNQEGLVFIDLWENWTGRDYQALLVDGAHPSSKGHQLITDKTVSFLQYYNLL